MLNRIRETYCLKRIAAIAALFVAFLVIVDVASWLAVPCAISDQHAYREVDGQHQNECPYRGGAVVSGIFLARDFIGGLSPEAWTAIATTFLAIFTWTLWDVAAGQYDLIEKQIAATHRPELKIYSAILQPFDGKEPVDQQPARAKFSIINAGTAVGTITGSAAYLEYRPPEDAPYLPEVARNDLIPARRFHVGATDTIIVASDGHGGLNHALIEESGKNLYLFGWLVYGEESKTTRTTYFCWEYRIETGRFVKSSDPDSNVTY